MSEQIRLVRAPLLLQYEHVSDETYDLFKREFDRLSELDEDPIGQWLKLARSRGETKESDQVLITLMAEMHRKIDHLSRQINNEEKVYLELGQKEDILSIGFGYFKIKHTVFEKDKAYYGRIEMPLFPTRVVPVFFKMREENIAQIELIHEQDEKDWNAYVTSRERVMIRELKAKK